MNIGRSIAGDIVAHDTRVRSRSKLEVARRGRRPKEDRECGGRRAETARADGVARLRDNRVGAEGAGRCPPVMLGNVKVKLPLASAVVVSAGEKGVGVVPMSWYSSTVAFGGGRTGERGRGAVGVARGAGNSIAESG